MTATRIIERATGQSLEAISSDIVYPGQLLIPNSVAMISNVGNVGIILMLNNRDQIGSHVWIATEINLPSFCESSDEDTYPVGSIISIIACLSGDKINARTSLGVINPGMMISYDTDNPGYVKKFDTSSTVCIGYAVESSIDGFVKMIVS